MTNMPALILAPMSRKSLQGVVRLALLSSLVLGTGCAGLGARHSFAAPPELGANDVVFASGSGSAIHAWFARGAPGKGAVLLLHGVGADRTSMQARALFLHARGFTVLAPDFQAHGESPGDHVTYGELESLDASAAMSFLRSQAPAERVGVIGVSMGGAASLLGRGPLSADAFVLESVYATFREAVRNRLGKWFGPLAPLGRALTPAAIRFIGARNGVTEAELEPIERIGELHAPLLLASGTADPYTPLAEAESLYARAVGPKSFWAVPGAGHEDLYAYGPVEYERRVGGFLIAHLR